MLCLNIKEKPSVSTGSFVFRAYICKTDVKNPCGKKKAEIQYNLGFSMIPCLINLHLSMRS